MIPCFACGIFIELGVAAHAQEPASPAGIHWLYDPNVTANPYGIVTLGWQDDISRRVSVSVAARHESSLATNRDYGVNSVVLTVRFRPWAR